MYKYEKEFRKENPQTIGETDKHFDLDNYKDWLEKKLEGTIETLSEVAELLDEKEMNVNSFEFKLWSKCNTALSEVS
jgi:hypothetical protein